MLGLRILFSLTLWLLLEEVIGPEQPLPESPSVRKSLGSGKSKPGPNHLGKKLPSRQDPGFDREAFLRSFRRQAELGLLQCLRANMAATGSAALAATFVRPGRLEHVTSLDQDLAKCATDAMAQMRFPDVGKKLLVTSLAIQWRIDW